MTFDELLKAVDGLSPDERQRLRDYINRHESGQLQETPVEAGVLDIDSLFRAFDEIRAGFTKEELAEVIEAMNAEYIEPLDESEWDV